MISGCNNKTCPLRSTCYRGQIKTEFGDTYILGIYDEGCRDYWNIKHKPTKQIKI